MIDQIKKRALIEHIKQRKTSAAEELLLPPDLFFDGYDDKHCVICANNSEPITTSDFASRLLQVRHKPEVSGVYVRVCDFSDAEEFEECWITSDSIYVVTTARVGKVREWFSDFEVSDIWEEKDHSQFGGLPLLSKDSRLIAVWWD
jgi:hypothetical protein